MHLTTSNQWPVWQLILFRFAFVFFGLYIIIQNNGAFPFWDVLMTYPTEGLHLFIPWVAKTFLSLKEPITVFTNGSGDTTYDNVIVLTIFVISIFSMIIWSVLDRNRQNYDQLYAWLLVGIRFYVGLMLINYGMVKVFKMQFSSPGPYRLLQSYGDSSPMGLAWTFLGRTQIPAHSLYAEHLRCLPEAWLDPCHCRPRGAHGSVRSRSFLRPGGGLA